MTETLIAPPTSPEEALATARLYVGAQPHPEVVQLTDEQQQLADAQIAQEAQAKEALISEIANQQHILLGGDYRRLSAQAQETASNIAAQTKPNLFARKPEKATDRVVQKIQRNLQAGKDPLPSKIRTASATNAEAPATTPEEADTNEISLENMEPKQRFAKVRSAYQTFKQGYSEAYKRSRNRSKDNKEQVASEETESTDTNLNPTLALLAEHGGHEAAINTIHNLTEKITAYNARTDRTDEQKHRYKLAVTRRATLGRLEISKLADSKEEAVKALSALRTMVDSSLVGLSDTEPADLDTLYAEERTSVLAELQEDATKKRDKLKRRIGRSVLAASIVLVGTAGSFTAINAEKSPTTPVTIEQTVENNGQPDNLITTAGGEVFKIGKTEASGIAIPESVVGGEQQKSYVVVEGDNLWNIVKGVLGPDATDTDIANGVNKVVGANNIQNPDLVHPDDEINLSTLYGNK